MIYNILKNNQDIRLNRPVLVGPMTYGSKPQQIIKNLKVYRDGLFYVVLSRSQSGELFFNRLELKFFIFMVHSFHSGCICSVEAEIKQHFRT